MDITDRTLLITGIGDFIGMQAAKMAIARGMNVIGLEPSSEKAKLAKQIGAQVWLGNTMNKDILSHICKDVDFVFHTESLWDASGDIKKFRQINVEGAFNVANAAVEAGVSKLIHLSSVLVYGFKYPERIAENGPLRGENNPLCQSKIEAEKKLHELSHPDDLSIVIIRAGDVYGPGSLTWVLKPVQLMLRNQFMLVNGGSGIFNHVYIDNLINAVFLSIEIAQDGEVFNITDGMKTTWKQFYTRLAKIIGVSEPISMPIFALKAVVRALGEQLSIQPEVIDFISRSNTYSIERARKLLGYKPLIQLDEGMRRTATWLSNNDLFLTSTIGG